MPLDFTEPGGYSVRNIKVIFLDVDGVLNSSHTQRRTMSGCIFVSSRQMKDLRHIVSVTDAKVVLTSDWRYERDDPRYNRDFLEPEKELLKHGIRPCGHPVR